MGAGASEQTSATDPDWSREKVENYSPGRSLLRAIRDYQRASRGSGPASWALKKSAILRHRFWSAVAGADIPVTCQLGGGLLLPHPVGIVIHPEAEVGPNCLLFQNVTLGAGGPIPGFPKLGGHVDVGAGAKILGGVTIGAHARIGANAVVLSDVPAHGVAVGVPARLVTRSPSVNR